MTNFLKFTTAILNSATIAVFASAPVAAQARQIPTRTLITNAVSSEEFTAPFAVRELPDGRVIIIDVSERRAVMLDAKLQNARALGQRGAGPGEYEYPMFVVPAPDNATYLGDMGNQRLLVLDANGKFSGQKNFFASPNPMDVSAVFTGTPAIDRQGRIVYQGANSRILPGMQIQTSSMAPILRRNFSTGVVDTLAHVRVNAPRIKLDGDPSNPSAISASMVADPFPVIDDWAMLGDGTLAIVRGEDYHIDWIAPDGRTTASAPMPYTKVAVTDALKKSYLLGMTKADSAMKQRRAQSGGMVPAIVQHAPESWPAFLPSINVRSMKATPEGNLWLVSAMASESHATYDIVSRQGISEHVQPPNGRMIIGFGAHSVYMVAKDSNDIYHVERAAMK